MSRIKNGGPCEIQPAPESVTIDVFENATVTIGIVNACERFGNQPDSEYTAETINLLIEPSEQEKAP